MIKINLLPPEIVAERKQRARQARFTGLVALVLILLLASLGMLFTMNQRVKKQVKGLAGERAALEAQIAQYAPYVQLQADVNNKSGLLKQAMGKVPGWAEVLLELGMKIPSNVWLTDTAVSFNPTDGKGQILLRGLTYDHPSTARWLDILGKIPGIDDVRCVFSAEETAEGKELVRFEIRAGFLPGAEYNPLAGRGE